MPRPAAEVAARASASTGFSTHSVTTSTRRPFTRHLWMALGRSIVDDIVGQIREFPSADRPTPPREQAARIQHHRISRDWKCRRCLALEQAMHGQYDRTVR